jgi:hypothetical protein
VAYPVILATWRLRLEGSGRSWFKVSLGKQFARPHLQNNQSKMDWRHGPCGRTPALPARSPEFKPQFYQKKKKT